MVPYQYEQRMILVDLVKDSSKEAVLLQGMGKLKVCISYSTGIISLSFVSRHNM